MIVHPGRAVLFQLLGNRPVSDLAALLQQHGDNFGRIHRGTAAQAQDAVTASFLSHFIGLFHHILNRLCSNVVIGNVIDALFIQRFCDLFRQAGHLHALVIDHKQFLHSQHSHSILYGANATHTKGDGALLRVVTELFICSFHSETSSK